MEETIKKNETIYVHPSDKIERNQIIAFRREEPNQEEQIWIFRVVGLPGDKVQIKKGQLYVNEQEHKDIDQIKYSYKVRTNGLLNQKAIENMEYEKLNVNNYLFYLTNAQRNKLKANPVVEDIVINIEDSGVFQRKIFGGDSINKWNRDNYGPLIVPNGLEQLYFVMGDNRHNAIDSRFIGYISKINIIGVVKNK
jgi:signal peptidase I